MHFLGIITLLWVSHWSDYWSHTGVGNHILFNIWKWVQVTVHVWPSCILGSFVDQVLVSMLLSEFLFLFCEFDLVVKELLGVCKILNGPLVFLWVLVFVQLLGDSNLFFSLGHDVFLLSFSESLEVIWNKSMRGKLRSGGFFVFSHDIAHVSSVNFVLVHFFLVLFPVRFSISLLLC